MEWEGRPESENVEDRRSLKPVGIALGGGGTILLVLLALFLGADPRQVLNQVQQQQGQQAQAPVDPAHDDARHFVGVVFKDTEDVWEAQFQRLGKTYRKPKLVLFSGRVESACGLASAAVGPFYCPGDQMVYLDLTFFEEMKRRFGAPGDFAQAYVIAHEVGHHVQHLLGYTKQMDAQRGQVSKSEYNKLSVRLELQADFLAGMWAHHAERTKHILQKGDIDEALKAANAIGDDALQKQSRGYVVPDSFTHGTSAQRSRWFKKGFQTGDLRYGDTFSVSDSEL